MSERPRPLWITLGWFALITIGALGVGIAAIRYQLVRPDPSELHPFDARVIPRLRWEFYVGIGVGMLLCVPYGVATMWGLWNQRRWARWLAMLPTFALPPLFWLGDQLIRDIEWVYYPKSPYALAFKSVAWPVVILGLLSLIALWWPSVRRAFAPAKPDPHPLEGELPPRVERSESGDPPE